MTAKETYQTWLNSDNLPKYLHKQLVDLGKNSAWIEDAFGTNIDFGTAGMRGLLEPGTNRINVVTVGKVTEGLAQLIEQTGDSAKKQGVVISFDPRYHSEEFAKLSAKILGHHGIHVYLFDELRPTPELSFAVRYLKTFAGIMITASHNAKQYNGYKIYGADGGQMPPESAAVVVDQAAKITDPLNIPTTSIEDLRASKTLQLIGEDVDEEYLKALKTVNVDHSLIDTTADKLKIVYTPVHGTGKIVYDRAFRQSGFNNVTIVPSQAILDPEFVTTVKPNPEYRQVFDEGIKVANKVDADIIVATDPDADRLGAAVRLPNGDFRVLTGNQIATLMANYLLTNLKDNHKLDSDYEIVTSVVSSSLPFKIAKSYGIKTRYVLTGFKYIAEEIDRMHADHDGKFLMGFEESYGYLFKPFDHDKDAMQGALMFFEVAAYYAARKMSVFDGLNEIWNKYGATCEVTRAIEMPGLDGHKRMLEIMARLREDNLTKIAGKKVVRIEDFDKQTIYEDGGVDELKGFPKANVLKYFLEDDTWIALRPSGTEPVIKAYVGATGKDYEQAQKAADEYNKAIDKLIN